MKLNVAQFISPSLSDRPIKVLQSLKAPLRGMKMWKGKDGGEEINPNQANVVH